jgi:tryptophan synthase alpha subunit
MLKAAFIFVAPKANSKEHRSFVATPEVELTTVGVSDYEAAVEAAKELVGQGIAAIELCGGFGIEGVAQVKKAVGAKVAVGVVRFDNHPGLQGKSGDELFR